MTLAFTIWLCGALPALTLALECRPRSIVEWLTGAAIVVLWPLFLLAFFAALLFGEEV